MGIFRNMKTEGLKRGSYQVRKNCRSNLILFQKKAANAEETRL